MNTNIIKQSNRAYIIEAMLEYFITVSVSSTYLTHVMTHIGISSSLQGIINSIISLGFGFQVLAILFPLKNSIKRKIIIFHSLGHLLFSFVFFVPLFNFPFELKVVAFIFSLISAYVIRNYIESSKISWCMSFVSDKTRGKFTADKEIVSIVGSMIFSFALGAIIDHYEISGELEIAFTIIGLLIVLLTIGHTASLLFVGEPQNEIITHKVSFKELFKNKKLITTILIFAVWNAGNYVTISFLGAYQKLTLGFSALIMTLYPFGANVIRILLTKPFGKFGDKYSFNKLLFISLILYLLSYVVLMFTVPSNGLIMYAIYIVLSYVGGIGTSTCQLNLIYDQVKVEDRSGAYAFNRMFLGFAGFIAVLIVSPLYEFIGDSGLALTNNFTLYPLPMMAFISFIVTLVVLIVMYFVNFRKKQDSKN